MGALRRYGTEPEARSSGGGGGKSARSDDGTPRARGPEQGDNAENGSDNGNRDVGPVRGPFEARLQVRVKRQVVQWIDGPDKTGSNGVGDEEDLGVKPSEAEPVGRRGALQLEVQGLELEQQPASQ